MISDYQINEQFLVHSAGYQLTESDKGSLKAILSKGDLDWDSLMGQAYNHGLVPVLFRHLVELDWKNVPDSFRQSLEEKTHEISDKNLRIAGEMVKILDVFSQHKIMCVPVKGPALANFLYGDVGMRQFDDLDILVKKEDVLRAEKILVSMGYTPAFDLTPLQKKKYLTLECEYNLIHNMSRLSVELHWRFVQSYIGFNWDYEYFEKSGALHQPPGEIPFIGPEEMCLALLVHNGLKHGFDRLCWYTDILQLWHKHPFNWNKFLKLAHETGCDNLVGLTVLNVRNLFDSNIPGLADREFAGTSSVTRVSRRVLKNLFKKVDTEPSVAHQTRYHLFLRDGVRRKIMYLLSLVSRPNSFDWKWIRLPDSLYFLYYVLRPVRLLRRYLLRGGK